MRLDDRVSLLVQEKVREQKKKVGIHQKRAGAEIGAVKKPTNRMWKKKRRDN